MNESESPFSGVPTQIVELSSNLADFVQQAIGLRPDFSPETLSLVDHYADLAREELKKRPELLDLTAQALGAYFGEVLRRNEGGFWLLPSPNFHDWSLCGLTAFTQINPIGVGYELLALSSDHSGPSSAIKLAAEDREAVKHRLSLLPEVPDTEFYSLCTRLEVIEIAMVAVRAEQSRRGYEEMIFSEEDYAAELRPLGI